MKPTVVVLLLLVLSLLIAIPLRAQSYTDYSISVVKDIAPGTAGSWPTIIGVVNNVLLFSAAGAGTNGASNTGSELWASDGTAEGTVKLAELPFDHYSFDRLPDGEFLFSGNDGVHGYEPWVTDGTIAGTHMLADINPSTGSYPAYTDSLGVYHPSIEYPISSSPERFTNLGASVIFGALDPVNGFGIWKTDGTAQGTVFLATICSDPDVIRVEHTGFGNFYPGGNYVYFMGLDAPELNNRYRWRLFRTDGTPEGTVKLPERNFSELYLTSFNGMLLAKGDAPEYGPELVRFNPAADTFEIVKDIRPGALGSNPRNFTPLNDALYFVASSDARPNRLWKTDGTPQGTVLVLDIPVDEVMIFGDRLLLSSRNWADPGVWISDGTSEGTVKIASIYAEMFSECNGTVYFTGYPQYGKSELWKTDGTAGGTMRLSNIWPGRFVEYDGMAYFTAHSPEIPAGWGLWKTDGSSQGTIPVKYTDTPPSITGFDPMFLTLMNGALYCSGSENASGRELWKIVATSSGPHPHTISTTAIDFGTITDSTGATLTMTLSNTGSREFGLTVACTDPHFSVSPVVATVPPGAEQTFSISYRPDAPGSNQGRIIYYGNGGDPPDTVLVTGSFIYTPRALLQANHVRKGWNLVSPSHTAGTMLKNDLYPAALTVAFGYSSDGYRASPTLSVGTGYWLKFPAEVEIIPQGDPVVGATVHLTEGWNLIGGISSPVPVAQVTADVPGVTVSNFFGYNGTYLAVETLLPGLGYWVKSNQACDLYLSAEGTMQGNNSIRIHGVPDPPPPPPSDDEAATGDDRDIPARFAVGQNYPNPFNPTTEITAYLVEPAWTTLKIYSIIGSEVSTLIEGWTQPGEYHLRWDASLWPSGVYYYRLTSGSRTAVGKMILAK